MKILILTEGDKNIGFGHLTRCISLYQAFRERGILPEFIINGDEVIEVLLKDKKYKIFNWLKERRVLFDTIKNADIAIIDSYLADYKLYRRVSALVKNPVYIDDDKRINYPGGIVINGSIYAEELDYPDKKDIVYLLGSRYTPLRKEFWAVPEKNINKEVKNILITFGGADSSDLSYKVANCLKDKFRFDFYIVNPKKNILKAKDILNLMLKADICISGGGQTTYELAKVGIPTIGVCFAENQRLNLQGWQEKGFVEYIGWNKDKHLLEKIVSAINKFMPFEERNRRSKIGRDCIDGKGVKRVIKRLFNE